MVGRLLDFVVGREPVAAATGLAGGVAAAIGVLQAFNVTRMSGEQIAAIGALTAWFAGWLARKAVSPVRGLALDVPEWVADPVAADPFDTAEGDSRLDT